MNRIISRLLRRYLPDSDWYIHAMWDNWTEGDKRPCCDSEVKAHNPHQSDCLVAQKILTRARLLMEEAYPDDTR